MAEKMLNTRIIHKHETAEDWAKATGFIPKQAELIVYDSTNDEPSQFKIGDGQTPINDLPFASAIYTVATGSKLGLVKSGGDVTVNSSGIMTVTDDCAFEIINKNTDQIYDATSVKPQSGTAVAQAIGLLEDHLLPVFIGTQAQYNTYQNVIETGTIVVILDDNAAQDFTEETLPILGTSALGQMAIG